MTGIDTNILIRFATADDPVQYGKAVRLMQSFSPESPGFVSQVCVAEFVWVLRNRYGRPKHEIVEWLIWLAESIGIDLENQVVVEKAIETYSRTRADFSDCIIAIAGSFAGCTSTVTFDKGAAKAAGMRLL